MLVLIFLTIKFLTMSLWNLLIYESWKAIKLKDKRAKENKTEEYKAEENKTEEYKAKENKTEE